MQKIKLTHQQLLWLYFYLRQIELSFEKATYQGWEEAVEFLYSRCNVKDIVIDMSAIHGLKIVKVPKNKLFLLLYRRYINSNFLYTNERQYIVEVLIDSMKLMNKGCIPEPEEITECCSKIREARKVFETIFGKRKLGSFGTVAHFNHCKNIEVKELEELVGEVKIKQQEFFTFE